MFMSSKNVFEPASCSSGNAFVSGARVLRFKSRAGQIEHSVASESLPLRYFFEKSSVARRCNDAEMGLENSLHALAHHSEYNERIDLMSSKLFV